MSDIQLGNTKPLKFRRTNKLRIFAKSEIDFLRSGGSLEQAWIAKCGRVEWRPVPIVIQGAEGERSS